MTLQRCTITIDDMRAAMPSWRLTDLGGDKVLAAHSAGISLKFEIGETIGEKAAILRLKVEHLCDLATRAIKD